LEVRAEILNSFDEIKKISEKSSYIDFCSSMAFVAYENNYVRPEISPDYDLEIVS
jgi:DNA mismatch repair ATPase MutS